MKIEVDINAKGLEKALYALAEALQGANVAPIHQVTDAPKQDEPAKEEKPKQKKAPAKEPEPKKDAPKKAEPKEDAKSVKKFTLETITTKTREIIKSGADNKEALRKWLEAKDLPRVSELQESQYDEFMAFAEELLG